MPSSIPLSCPRVHRAPYSCEMTICFLTLARGSYHPHATDSSWLVRVDSSVIDLSISWYLRILFFVPSPIFIIHSMGLPELREVNIDKRLGGRTQILHLACNHIALKTGPHARSVSLSCGKYSHQPFPTLVPNLI